jgi:hypothetical protein
MPAMNKTIIAMLDICHEIAISAIVIGTYTTNGIIGCTCESASRIGFLKSFTVSSLFDTNFEDIYSDVTS